MYALKTRRDTRKLKWQNNVRNMPKKRLPVVVDRAEWEKVGEGRAGIKWWDSVVEKVWKDIGGNQGGMMSAEKIGRYKTALIRKKDGKKGKASAKKQDEIG